MYVYIEIAQQSLRIMLVTFLYYIEITGLSKTSTFTFEAAVLKIRKRPIAFYLNDLAAQFHGLWNKGNDDPGLRFIQPDDVPLSQARLALIRAVALVIASGLAILGVTPVEEMH